MNIVLDRLKEIVSAVMYAAEAPDLEAMLERIAQVSRELARTRYAALGIPDGRGGLRYFKVAGLTPEQMERIDHLPRGIGLLGAIMQERRAIRLERMVDDSRSAGFCANHPFMNSLLGVPIQIGQQLFGVLYLCDKEDGKPFTDEDEWLVETMAGYAALAIAGSTLSDQQSRMKLLEERERIGMELHDGVIQSLYALGMHVDLLRAAGAVRSDELSPVIDGLNSVIEDIRRYIMNLQKGGRDTRHFTVRSYLKQMLGRLHVQDTLQIEIDAPDEPPPFTTATFEGIFLIVNEAISNAVRHASATRIRVTVRQVDSIYSIQIHDNGLGFDPHKINEGSGLGLRNMQQRARIYGGRVDIESLPGQGTLLTISVPVRLY